VFAFSMQAEQSIVVDPKSPGGINSPHGLILFDGVCVLCSRGCRFVSKRDRRGYFRFVPIQLAEGRPLAEQLGIDPDRPDSFAFLANGRAYVKSEAVLRIARELPRWQWTWVFQFIPRVIRDAIYDLVAPTAIAGLAIVTLASCRIRIAHGHREPPRNSGTMAPDAGWLRPA
jgi:predicted DCC family thiol-disulfide oxidoreductase YuxK